MYYYIYTAFLVNVYKDSFFNVTWVCTNIKHFTYFIYERKYAICLSNGTDFCLIIKNTAWYFIKSSSINVCFSNFCLWIKENSSLITLAFISRKNVCYIHFKYWTLLYVSMTTRYQIKVCMYINVYTGKHVCNYGNNI